MRWAIRPIIPTDSSDHHQVIRYLRQGHVDGVLLISSHAEDELPRQVHDLGIPAGYTVEAAVAIGKRGDKKILPESLRSIEAPNGRRPVTEFVFEGLFEA